MSALERLQSLSQRRPWATFLVGIAMCALVGLGGVFWGFDIADSGFYLTFYDQFYKAPGTVSYNFMYYMSGVLGGALQEAFPTMGIVGMRFAGLALCLLAATVLFVAWRRVDSSAGALETATGALLVTLAFLPPLYTLSYDLFTVIFYCVAIALLLMGCHKGNRWLLALGGMALTLNAFSRVPNVLSVLLLAAVVVDARRRGLAWRQAVARCMWVLAGAAFMVAVVVMVMRRMGHWQLMMDNIADLRAIASDDSGTTSHTTGQLLMTQARFYGALLWCAVKLGVCTLLLDFALACREQRALRWTMAVAAVALWCFFTWRMRPLQPLWLMTAVACVAVFRKQKGATATLALMGLIMLVVMPLGSDGAYNNGAVIAWGAAPVAGLWWLATKRRRILLVAFLVVCLGRLVFGGSYFDAGPLTGKTATIHSPRAAHVLTTPERAAIVNDLLDGIAPYIHEGDTLMAYGSLPTINYLTGTRPFLGCSWPEQLAASMLEKKLTDDFDSSPLVLRQKFNTLGDTWTEPSERYLSDYGPQTAYQNNAKLDVLNRWMLLKGYREVWSNDHFTLYAVPEPFAPPSS